MASFSFTVDTEPMARSIEGVTRHVDGVTTAVVAMQTAVVATEKEAADNICRNVNKGFYTLIRSQISQKIARLSSQANSKLMEMGQQNASLASIKNQMERDYMMIGSRYTKLFNSLNKSLKTRIFELDKPTTNFVANEIEPAANRLRLFLGKVPVLQAECVNTSQVLTASNTKSNALRAINAIKDFISQSKEQKKLINLILKNEPHSAAANYKVPFMVVEAGGLTVQQSQWSYYLPVSDEPALNNRLNKLLQTRFFEDASVCTWQVADGGELQKVSAAYRSLVEKADLPARLKQEMVKLMENNAWQSLKTTSK